MAVQRAIEMAGIPTVLITVDPEASRPMRPPRAVHPEGFSWGHSLGEANAPELQMEILRGALRQLEELHWPGSIQPLRVRAAGGRRA